MTALPNPFLPDPPPFVLDEQKFLDDIRGTHELPKVEPLPLEAFPELLKAG